MRRMMLAMPLLSLSLLTPGRVVAGPPETISGRVLLDEVEDGLRRYRRENDAGRRVKWLERLAPKRDKRVEDAFWAALSAGTDSAVPVAEAACELLRLHYGRECQWLPPPRPLPDLFPPK